MHPSCFQCRFFSPCDDGIPAAATKDNFNDCIQGLCRINPPTVGRFRGEGLDLEYDYGQWPLVLSGDWCGAFQPCQCPPPEGAAPTRHVGAGSNISRRADHRYGRAAGADPARHLAQFTAGSRFLPGQRRR